MAKFPPRDTYHPDVASEICRRLANGESLRRICGPDRPPGVPERITVYNWMKRHPQFDAAYRLARRAQAELHLDAMVEIADGLDENPILPRDLARDGWRIRARHWHTLVSVKLYPDRPEPEPPVTEASQEHAAARIAALLEEVRRRHEEKESGEDDPV